MSQIITLTQEQVLAYHAGERVPVLVPVGDVPEGYEYSYHVGCHYLFYDPASDGFYHDIERGAVYVPEGLEEVICPFTPDESVKCREEWRGGRMWNGVGWTWNITYRDGFSTSVEKCNRCFDRQSYYQWQPPHTMPPEFMREYRVHGIGGVEEREGKYFWRVVFKQ